MGDCESSQKVVFQNVNGQEKLCALQKVLLSIQPWVAFLKATYSERPHNYDYVPRNIIIEYFSGYSSEKGKRFFMAVPEYLKSFAGYKLHKRCPAESQSGYKGGKRLPAASKFTPVHLHLPARQGFKTHHRFGGRNRIQTTEIRPQQPQGSAVSKLLNLAKQHRCRKAMRPCRFDPSLQVSCIRIKLARTFALFFRIVAAFFSSNNSTIQRQL